ncbi:MAG: CoA-acylating methylmalonate-semialdehyde dehydrogenase [Chloroflexi bacterium]|nr:CoA-acylating methylmalonate-semialdehyde dehydrogenase [Chloroflexota bacterium]
MTPPTLKNYVAGEWLTPQVGEYVGIINPATGETLAQAPVSGDQEVAEAVQAAAEAFPGWRDTTPYARAQFMFRLKAVMEARSEDLARTVVREHGKIIEEARGEVRRAIENVEVAAGVPTLMMGYNMEDVSIGIDEDCLHQPLGVFACVAPFNFPAMVPMWFLPYAVTCGNTYVLKPSDRCPMTQTLLFELLEDVGLPPGVLNLVHGGKAAVDALLAHPDVQGISFVGSTPVAKYLYAQGAAHGKRMQCQAGAKNALVVMPDADLAKTVPNVISSAFGSSGQRCLAGSLVIAVGDAYEPLVERLVPAAAALKVGDGLDESVDMGPVISREAVERVHRYIDGALAEGARLLLDGRGVQVAGRPDGYYVGPTILTDVRPEMAVAREEVFGPLLAILRAADLDEALAIIDGSPYGNAASIFTTSGAAARTFRHRVRAGNVGVNIGVAAPIASFPFSGMKQSFFGDLHGQGRDAIRFFTERKVVITRW